MRLFGYLLLLLISLRAGAQSSYYEEEPQVFSGGIVAGANFTQVDGDSYFGYHKVGFTGGGVVYAHFTKVFGASMELTYSQKGSRGESVLESPVVGTYVAKYYMNVNYIELPLTVHIVTRKLLDVEAGVSYARLVSSKEWVLSDLQVVVDPERNRFNNTDINYIFGLGAKVYKQFHLNLRFQYSLNSIRPPDRIPYGFRYGNIGQFNNMFSLRVMYMF